MSTSIGLTDTIAKQEWLKPAEEGLQKVVHQLFASGGEAAIKVKDALHGTWVGHPLHVILTDIPLGAWTSTMLFDGLSAISGSEALDSAADACVATGLAGAIAAAVTGLTDWQDVDPPARRIGLVHGLLNLAAASIMGISLLKRRRDSRSSGRGLGLLGFLVATTAARLGGNLVYEHRVGVDRAAEKPLPDHFTATIAEAELEEGKPKRVEINATPIVLLRSGDEIYALAETCSHLGGPLAEGKVEDGTIQCPWHGWLQPRRWTRRAWPCSPPPALFGGAPRGRLHRPAKATCSKQLTLSSNKDSSGMWLRQSKDHLVAGAPTRRVLIRGSQGCSNLSFSRGCADCA